jgi:hypothetical protein
MPLHLEIYCILSIGCCAVHALRIDALAYGCGTLRTDKIDTRLQ